MRAKMTWMFTVALMLVVVAPALSQGTLKTVRDDGGEVQIPAPWLGPVGENFEADGSLTTQFASNNGFAGNMFDLEVLGGQLVIESFDMNIALGGGPVETVQLYFREGGSFGFETDPTAWTFFGEDTGVVAQGVNVPTPVAIGGLVLEPGIVYGIYLHLESYPNGGGVEYTNGGPTVYANADLQLTTNTGNPHPAFSGTFFPREWNGTVYYNFGGGVPTMPAWGMVLLAAVLLAGSLLAYRRRHA